MQNRRWPAAAAAASAAALLALGAPPSARADDPDLASLQSALDQASADVDTAWLGTLVDYGQLTNVVTIVDPGGYSMPLTV